MVVIKPEDLNIVEDEDAEEDLEHGLIKDSVLELTKSDFGYNDESEALPMGSIRKRAVDITADYEGKPVSRKKLMELSWATNEQDKNVSAEEESENEDDFKDDSSDEEVEGTGGEEEDSGDESEIEKESLSESEIEDDSDFKDDDCPFDLGLNTFNKSKDEEDKSKSGGIDMFSTSGKGIKQDIEKGRAIRNQLSTWEHLLESRIKLQKGLLASNRLFQHGDFKNFKDTLEPEEEAILTKTYNGLSDVMGVLLDLQDVMLKSCVDYVETKRKTEGEEKEKDTEESNREDDGESEPNKKKMKLSEYDQLLEKHRLDFKTYQDSTIQKWNDKTRVLSGKISSSDFDQSTLKQIEQILCDKSRLVRRTQLKRSEYKVLGKLQVEKPDGDQKQDGAVNEYDPEIFDDDDFYHKLLRDFLDRKTSDITDPTQLGRRWVELQKLRSKMKRKIDVRATKGRRLRFTVHNKLVNFMAPIPYNTWTDEAETQLFSSLFGKAGIGD